ncbi:MAG: cation:proton antiporter, partial [Phycisphaerales bacterium]
AQFGSLAIAVEAMLIVAFFFLTAPVAAHLIARAGFAAKIRMWEQTEVEERSSTEGDEPDADGPPRG